MEAAGQVSPYMPQDGRFAGRLACSVKDLPLCPSSPTCLDDDTAWAIAGCIAKSYMHDEHRAWCEGGLGPLFYAQADFCTPEHLPQQPSCLDAQAAADRDYCRSHGAEGPDPTKNALCWLAMHDSAWWSQYNNVKTCAETATPPPPPAPPPAPPAPTPTYTAPPAPLPPPEPHPDKRSTATMGVFGVLGLIAVGGTGYYLWQRRKR
jgi:hypothetical protein